MDNNINLGYSNFFSSVRKSNLSNILPTNVQTVNLGHASVTNDKIDSLTADKITTSTLSATTVITVGATAGGGYIKIDAVNKRIIINDGTVDRIVIGYLAGGF